MNPTETKELLGWLFHKLGIPKRELAELLGVDRNTIARWEETGHIDFGACRIILQLLEGQFERFFPLLEEHLVGTPPERDPWPDRVRAMQEAFNLKLDDFADLLEASVDAVNNWKQGYAEPMSCHAVLLDLIEDYPDTMADLLGFVPVEDEEEGESWPKDRIQGILARAGLTTSAFASLIGIENQSVTAWLRGTSVPSGCSAFFLRALEKFPVVTVRGFKNSDRGPWEPRRATAAREKAGLSVAELSRITGIADRNLRDWEEAMPEKKGCPKVLYSMIERNPNAFLGLARQVTG